MTAKLIVLDCNKRIKFKLQKLDKASFLRLVNGFSPSSSIQILDDPFGYWDRARSNFDAFWEDVGPIVRNDIFRHLQDKKASCYYGADRNGCSVLSFSQASR